jgi:cyclopropane-fatty-acyl-phospholipid synthase
MTLLASTLTAFETAPVPDMLRKQAVAWLVAGARKRLATAPQGLERQFAQAMAEHPIATHTDEANAQHYEVPSGFFERVLGPRLKYSSCFYEHAHSTLAEAEVRALELTCEHADLQDGHRILELGCGWGSLSLWMAQHYPNALITAVSNSATQRSHILAKAAARGLDNLRVVTADMNDFNTDQRFDRVVSVEMFEHMSNWRALFARVRGWMNPDARAFIHVFTHRSTPYRFDPTDKSDWIAQHFFTGGVMPSHGLIRQFPDLFEVEQEWVWNGGHYQRTALDWLANFDNRIDEIRPILAATYGKDARIWEKRWRLFFLATAGLFGDSGGREWAVSHYRLSPRAA